MNKLALSLVAVGAVFAASAVGSLPARAEVAPVSSAAASTVLTGAERTAALARASAALNKLTAAQGRFTQTAPNGAVSQGEIAIQRPGKLRFRFDPPSGLTIVSDGSVVSIEDRANRDIQRLPLRSTPLYYVLKSDVNLERDARITRVVRVGDQLRVSARDKSGEADGEITITFAGPALDLQQWSITDGQAQTTRITLAGVRKVDRLAANLFRPSTPVDPTPRSRR